MIKHFIIAFAMVKIYTFAKIIFMNWSSLSNSAIIEEVGRRLKESRLRKKLTQQEVAEQAGISIFSVAQVERGKAVTLNVFLSIVRVLRLLDNLELLIPEVGISPMALLKLKGKTPKRIKKSKSEDGIGNKG